MHKKLLYVWVLIVGELSNITASYSKAKKSARFSRVLVVTEHRCKGDPLDENCHHHDVKRTKCEETEKYFLNIERNGRQRKNFCTFHEDYNMNDAPELDLRVCSHKAKRNTGAVSIQSS